jgi:hypothetical protein
LTLKTNGTASFSSSEMHNIAFVNQEGKIDYKFANQFAIGDKLVSFPIRDLSVQEIEAGVKKKGLFSPYTNFNNYFILEDHFDYLQSNKEPQLFLVHVLSQV